MAGGKTSELGEQFANISVDVNYWTLALKITKICKAKAYITKKHRELMQKLQEEKEKIKESTDIFDKILIIQILKIIIIIIIMKKG